MSEIPNFVGHAPGSRPLPSMAESWSRVMLHPAGQSNSAGPPPSHPTAAGRPQIGQVSQVTRSLMAAFRLGGSRGTGPGRAVAQANCPVALASRLPRGPGKPLPRPRWTTRRPVDSLSSLVWRLQIASGILPSVDRGGPLEARGAVPAEELTMGEASPGLGRLRGGGRGGRPRQGPRCRPQSAGSLAVACRGGELGDEPLGSAAGWRRTQRPIRVGGTNVPGRSAGPPKGFAH